MLGLEWQPWAPVDILSLGKLLAFGLSTNWERELLRADMVRALGPELTARLDPAYPADNPVVDQSAWNGEGLPLVEQIDAVRRALGLATEASGSNNWAVSGERSVTGMPLIAGDPHLPPSMPAIWEEIELRTTDEPLRPRRLAARDARRLHGPGQRRLLDDHQRDGRRPGPLHRAGRGRQYLFEDGVAAAGDADRGDRRQGARASR